MLQSWDLGVGGVLYDCLGISFGVYTEFTSKWFEIRSGWRFSISSYYGRQDPLRWCWLVGHVALAYSDDWYRWSLTNESVADRHWINRISLASIKWHHRLTSRCSVWITSSSSSWKRIYGIRNTNRFLRIILRFQN